MQFKLGAYGFSQFQLQVTAGMLVLDHDIPLAEMKIRDHFIEFPAEGLWRGLTAINVLAEFLKDQDPGFGPARAKVWVDEKELQVFLAEKLLVAEKAMVRSARLLKQGRGERPKKSNEKARQAREMLETALHEMQLS